MPPHHPSPCPPCSCLSAPDGDSSVSQQEVARPPPSSPVLHRSPPLALRSPPSIDVHSRLTSSPTVTARGCDNGLSSLQESARHAHRATCLAHYPPPPWSQPNRSSCECGGVRGLQEAARHAPHHLAGAVHGAVHRGDGGELKDMHVALCRGVGGGERMEGRDGRVPGPDGWSNLSSAASRRQYDPPVHALCTPLTLKLGNLTICLAVGACTEMRRPSPRLSTLHA